MRAMILAAGRGERMRELTAQTPKPLLRVAGHYLIEYAIGSLKRAGINEIVINVSYRGEQIKQALGDGERYGVKIFYSEEQERLETGGGIFKALPMLGTKPFLVVSSDIITDYPLQNLLTSCTELAHLLMVPNPDYHQTGDYSLKQGKICEKTTDTYTFASVAALHPTLFTGCYPTHFRLTQVLTPAIAANKVTGECYQGPWFNVGTPEDLAQLNALALVNSTIELLASELNTLSNY